MPRFRLVPVLFVKNGLIVRCENFNQHKIIGNVFNQPKRYCDWLIDELLVIDISTADVFSGRNDHKVRVASDIFEVIKMMVSCLNVPLTFGGRINDLDYGCKIIDCGADKVFINSLVFDDPIVIMQLSEKYGNQAISLCIDYAINGSDVSFYKNLGQVRVNYSVDDMLLVIKKLMPGEVVLHNIQRDGAGDGYELSLVEMFAKSVDCQVLVMGGFGHALDAVEAAKSGADGACIGNHLHFTEDSYPRIKQYLHARNVDVRGFQ
jgi:imidazole glycerol-phosphate synthase subunit HisF